jgi:hypothetical protein
MKKPEGLYKTCKHSTEVTEYSGPENNRTISFLNNYCSVYKKKCKEKKQCDNYVHEVKSMGKLSGER